MRLHEFLFELLHALFELVDFLLLGTGHILQVTGLVDKLAKLLTNSADGCALGTQKLGPVLWNAVN